MLIELNVTNYRSFKDTGCLQMTASPAVELREENSFVPPVPGMPRLLRSAVMYGPNASGKSNLLKAMFFMKRFVLGSAQGQEGDVINVAPFLFDQKSQNQPCEFEVLFIADGVRYQYGFAADQTRVFHEWLLAYPQGRPQRWFERLWNEEKQKDDYSFSTKFTGKKKIWQEATRSNALFLSSAIQLNNEQLKPVFYWFKHLVVIRQQDILDPVFSMLRCQDELGRQLMLKVLNQADLSIDDIKFEEQILSKNSIDKKLLNKFDRSNKNIFTEETLIRVLFGHQVSGSDKMVWLPLEEESDGTRKFFAYAGPLLDGLQQGRIFLIDELDNSLHPYMVRFLLGLFHNSTTNTNNAQLIFTTYDTSILDQKIMRRDQIWFMEKNEQNASVLYPLSDFKPRKHEALAKGYLQGRYGALPCIGEVNF